ncbi:MAG TPA: LysR family transcriptional regulator [Burkholderiales bacterium]|nr:LysR family transcriptional regulator [Burkholderiales bacterium]
MGRIADIRAHRKATRNPLAESEKPFTDEQEALVRSALDDERILSGQIWGELRVFLAVAKAKSFSRAAEMLGTSQPTVGRQVKRLQDVMGSQLFISTQHGVRLTPKGRELAKSLSDLDHRLFALTNDLRAESQGTAGQVRISVTDGLNTFFLAPALTDFSRQFPKIQVHLKSPLNVMSLRENKTDMMLGFSPDGSADITSKRLGKLHFIPVASKGYIKKNGLPTRTNLDRHFFVDSEMYGAQTGLWEPWRNCTSQGTILHRCDNSFAYGMLVKAGVGIGLLGSYTIIEREAMPLEIMQTISVPLYALALTERLNAKPVRLAFDWICDIFGTNNPWFANEFRADVKSSGYDAGFKMLFNLE